MNKCLLLVWLSVSGCTIDYDDSPSDYPATIEGVVQFLEDRCSNCHGYDPGQGGLELPTDLAEIVVAGDPAASPLWQRLDRGEMPPAGNVIEPPTYAHIRQWILDGAVQP